MQVVADINNKQLKKATLYIKLVEYMSLLKCLYYHPHGTSRYTGYFFSNNTSGVGPLEPYAFYLDRGRNSSLVGTRSEMLCGSKLHAD